MQDLLVRQRLTPAGRLIVAGLIASIAGFSGSAAAADQTFGVLLKNIKKPFWSAADEGAKDAVQDKPTRKRFRPAPAKTN
jgi:ABC-type sugar transport system substrate-binding protein